MKKNWVERKAYNRCIRVRATEILGKFSVASTRTLGRGGGNAVEFRMDLDWIRVVLSQLKLVG